MSASNYCIDLFQYKRYKTSEVKIGNLLMGNDHPIVVQSMTTTNTNDTEATVEQIKTIFDAGGQMVRMTTQGQREATNLKNIKEGLTEQGYNGPLVADIHFNPNAASIAAQHIEKVRINPGNFVDGAKKFETIEYTNETYYEELELVKRKLIPLLKICKKNNTAIRIGTNHGSLSDRIMSRYGDTPKGMVESCMEFLRICQSENFYNIVLSIKASNARIMVHTVRLLVQKMHEEDMYFPLHLGVTEAGEGEDGRIRSAVGIGTLLADGIGDTIRVSLTENPENEIPVADAIIQYTLEKENHPHIKPVVDISSYSPFNYVKRKSASVLNIGDNNVPIVISNKKSILDTPDYIFENNILNAHNAAYPFFDYQSGIENIAKKDAVHFVSVCYDQLGDEFKNFILEHQNAILILKSKHMNSVAEQRAAFLWFNNHEIKNPVILHKKYSETFNDLTQIKASCDFGPLLMDGFGDGIWIEADGEVEEGLMNKTAFSILQAARVRFEKPDYISCPGCGRTLFGLQETTAKVKSKTSHLKGLKIAVMGCIVNGPGEMADADYGYVGSGPGKITLYHQKEVVKRNIDEQDAVNELIQLIKENGDWVDPV